MKDTELMSAPARAIPLHDLRVKRQSSPSTNWEKSEWGRVFSGFIILSHCPRFSVQPGSGMTEKSVASHFTETYPEHCNVHVAKRNPRMCLANKRWDEVWNKFIQGVDVHVHIGNGNGHSFAICYRPFKQLQPAVLATSCIYRIHMIAFYWFLLICSI